MPEDKAIRAFLAIEAPEAVRNGMTRIQNRLKIAIPGAIRWAGPAGIHLTLKFFGDIEEADVERISSVVHNGVAGVKAFPLEIKSLGVFPDLRRPRVIWLGTTGDMERLAALQRKLAHEFGNLGFAEEERPFRAHWTLGRIKSAQGLAGLARAIESGAGMTAGAFNAEALILFKSDLTPRGAVYTRLAEYALKG